MTCYTEKNYDICNVLISDNNTTQLAVRVCKINISDMTNGCMKDMLLNYKILLIRL